MTGMFLPIWLIGAPFIGMLLLSVSFRGPSAMQGGPGTRVEKRDAIVRNNAIVSGQRV
jgi:hypothetical protein